jgi:class 3 adenylate cyclase/CRP-like cAMP-binding protein
VTPPADREIEERKVVTVLFADLTASTELAARLDPEDLRAVLRPFFEAMVEEINRFDGTVEKFIGDAIVAVFGVPASHEDDPVRAVRAALSMLRRLESLNPELAASQGVELAMRIGVNTGDVVTATGVDQDSLVTGEPVNIAARFQGLADPGGVVVGERTYRDARHLIRFESIGEVSVKGIDRPLRAWTVMGEQKAAPPGAAGSLRRGPMVGREEELELLELMFARTIRQRRPSLVTVLGPAGIGKSRLAHELAGRLRTKGAAGVVRGRCLAYGEGLTYWPMAEILKADVGILDNDAPETIAQKTGASLAGRFEEEEEGTGIIRVLLSSIGIPVHPDPLAGAEPAAARELIARSWRAYLESLASLGPLLALLEDLHWADANLLDLVENLAARVSAPVMFLALARPDLAERRPTWGSGIRDSTTLALPPLSTEEGQHLVQQLLEGRPAPHETIRLLLDRAEGNPFYAQELVRMVIEDGSLVRSNGGWALQRPLPASLPDTVQGVIASRLDLLPPAQKRVLQDAAVVGRIFWKGAVERLGAQDVAPLIDALLEKELVWEREASVIEGEREFIFNHVLTKDVAYASIPKGRRALAHAQALSWIEEVIGSRHEEFAEILAYHAERASDEARTARYAMLAGHRNRRVFAASEAIRWYDRALEAIQRSAETPDRAMMAEVALSRGEAKEQLGRFADAGADYELALSDARGSGDGALQAQALAALAHVYWLQDRFEEGRTVLTEALERARAIGAMELLARLLYTAGTLDFGQGRFREALTMHQEALKVAEAANDLGGEALARHGLCETMYFTGPFDRALAEGRRADELFRALGQRPMVYHNVYMVGWLLWLQGRVRESIEASQEAVEGCRELGNRRDEGFALARSIQLTSAGELGRAIREGAEAIRIAQDIQTPRLELAARGIRVSALAEAGRWQGIESEVKRCIEMADRMRTDFSRPRLFAINGWLARRNGDVAKARGLFREGLDLAGGILLDVIWNLWTETLAYEEANDEAGLRSAAERLTEAARSDSPLFVAWGTYGRGLAAGLRGDWPEAANLADQSMAAARSFGERSLEWRAARLSWKALAGLGRCWDAMVQLARAAQILAVIADSLQDDELSRSFLGRPPVAEVWEAHSAWLLGGLAPEELDAVRSVATVREVGAGQAVFRRGDPGDAIFVIDQGAVSIVLADKSAEGRVLARLGPGEAFGEVALLDGEPRTADAVADAHSRLIELPRDEFLRLLADHPTVAERLMEALGSRTPEGKDAAREGFPDIPARLTKAIQALAFREGRAGASIEILPVFASEGTIRYLRPIGGDSLQIGSGGSHHPNEAVVAALGKYRIEPKAVHSTSWRYERGRLILTYLAVLDGRVEPPQGMSSLDVRRADLARGSATGPPPSIQIDSVVEHALRHLAWLLQDDPAIKRTLGDRWTAILSTYEPEPFRSFGQFEMASE